MLRIDAVSIFPAMLEAALSDGIVGRARASGIVDIELHDLRDYTSNKHRSVDDAPYGGGPGMVMKPEPFFAAVETLLPDGAEGNTAVVLLSPRGRAFDQSTAERYAGLRRLVLLCGRYEGVDERVATHLATEEVSLGDFVLTGGEVAAMAVAEATIRLLPGALGDAESARADSFAAGTLDHPHYTRPSDYKGLRVPEVLLSGDHEAVRRWRRAVALQATRERRPDLLGRLSLSEEDRELILEQSASPAVSGASSAQHDSMRIP